jgi:hypothetical protein
MGPRRAAAALAFAVLVAVDLVRDVTAEKKDIIISPSTTSLTSHVTRSK